MNMHSKSNITLSLLIWFLFGLLALGQLQRFQLPGDISLYVHDLVLVIMAGWLGARTWKNRNWPSLPSIDIKQGVLLGLVLAWVILGWGVAIVAGGNLLVTLMYAGRLALYSVSIFLMAVDRPWEELLPEYQSTDVLRGLVTFSGLLVLGLGLLQYLFLPDTRFLHILGWDDHYFRLIGTQLDPGFTGIILVLTLLNVTTFKYFWPWIRKALQLLLVVAVALTFSRASYLALLLGLLYLTVTTYFQSGVKKTLWWIALGCWLGLVIPLLPKPTGEGVQLLRTSTVVSRTSRTEEIMSTMKPWQWVIGRGFLVPLEKPSQVVANQEVPYHAHFSDNLLVLLLTSLGVAGTILILLTAGKFLWPWRNNQFLMASMIVVIVHSQFNHTLLQPFVWLYLWLGIASEVLKRRQQTNKSGTVFDR